MPRATILRWWLFQASKGRALVCLSRPSAWLVGSYRARAPRRSRVAGHRRQRRRSLPVLAVLHATMRWARKVGLPTVARRLSELSAAHGARFAAPAMLARA